MDYNNETYNNETNNKHILVILLNYHRETKSPTIKTKIKIC